MVNANQVSNKLRGMTALLFLFCVAFVSAFFHFVPAVAQTSKSNSFRYGEKLTYNISFDKFANVAYAEIYVASNGTIGGKKAVELQGKIKSFDLFSAIFYLFDHTRTVYASEESGYPLYIRDASNMSGIPEEKVLNYLNEPATGLDLLTMFFKVRESGGAGSFSVLENGRIYGFDFALSGGETVATPGGTFETNLSTVSSPYFTEHGVSNVRVNFSADEDRIPVRIRFSTDRGSFSALLAGSSIIKPEATPEPAVTPTPTPTPVPTPTPTPSPTPFIENQSLAPDLPFRLGEKLRYSVKRNDVDAGQIEIAIDGRRELGGEDTLVLKVAVGQGSGDVLSSGEGGEAWLDPVTLVPRRVELRFSGAFSPLSQSVVFDQTTGVVVYGAGDRVEVPIGTHSPLSFLYAVRSFNLFPSRDPKNPVNDTRVAVFINDQPNIFTLRPSSFERLDMGGRKVSAQLITIVTGDDSVDRLRPRIWLSADARRLPLKIMFGDFQADLIR